MLDLKKHKYMLCYNGQPVCHFSNIPLAVLTGYVRCSFDPSKRQEMLKNYTIEERGTGKQEPVSNYQVDYNNGAYIYRGSALSN